jgi:hypothetical protein
MLRPGVRWLLCLQQAAQSQATIGQVRDAISLKRYSYRIEQAYVDQLSGTQSLGCLLHVIAQHQLFWVRMQIHLLVHPVGNRIAA